MEHRGFQEYKEHAINTMTPGELLLLLYDELIKQLTRAGLALDQKKFDIFEASVDKSRDIVQYLDDILDKQYAIGRDLDKMYEFILYELIRVKIGRNRTELERVRTMSMELRDSFRAADRGEDAGKQGG